MTDAQLAAVLAFLAATGTGIATLIKWGVGRVVAAMDRSAQAILDNTAGQAGLKELAVHVLQSNRDSIASNTALAAKVDAIAGQVGKVSGFVDEVTGQHEVPVFGDEPTIQGRPTPRAPKTRTPGRGIGQYRYTPPPRDDDK